MRTFSITTGQEVFTSQKPQSIKTHPLVRLVLKAIHKGVDVKTLVTIPTQTQIFYINNN